MRESGYYWIKKHEDDAWSVALYLSDGQEDSWTAEPFWWINGHDVERFEEDIFLVNENRILSPDEL